MVVVDSVLSEKKRDAACDGASEADGRPDFRGWLTSGGPARAFERSSQREREPGGPVEP